MAWEAIEWVLLVLAKRVFLRAQQGVIVDQRPAAAKAGVFLDGMRCQLFLPVLQQALKLR